MVIDEESGYSEDTAPCYLHQPEDVTHRDLYTEQLLHGGILTQRGLCTENLCTQTPLHSEFLHKEEVFLHSDALRKEAFAHINKGA